jgi:hypothetical protein
MINDDRKERKTFTAFQNYNSSKVIDILIKLNREHLFKSSFTLKL